MKVKNKRKKGENKDIELTFHHFDFFSLAVLLSYVESNTNLLPSTSLAQSNLENSCRSIFLIFHRFFTIEKERERNKNK